MIKKIVRKIKLGKESPKTDLAYWLNQPAECRIEAVEVLRREHYGSSTRLQRDVCVIKSTLS